MHCRGRSRVARRMAGRAAPVRHRHRTVRELALREPGKVSIYLCGPTVYGPPHLGHGRATLVYDILRRYLEWSGLEVRLVSNITDIDDKIINRANARGSALAGDHHQVRGGVVRGDGRHRRRPPDRRPPRHRVRGARWSTMIGQLVDARPGLPHRRRRVPGRRDRSTTTACSPTSRSTTCSPAAASARCSAPTRSATRPTSCCGSWPSRASRRGRRRGATGRPGWHTRVRGDEPRPARRGLRPPLRRPGPALPAPRERAGPGGRARQDVRQPLDAPRLRRRRRGREDVEEPRQLRRTCSTSSTATTPAPTGWCCCRPTTAARSQVGQRHARRRGQRRSPASTRSPPAPRRACRAGADADADVLDAFRAAMDDDLDTPEGHRRWSSTPCAGPTPPSTPADAAAAGLVAAVMEIVRRRRARARRAGDVPADVAEQAAALDEARAAKRLRPRRRDPRRTAGRRLDRRDDQSRYDDSPVTDTLTTSPPAARASRRDATLRRARRGWGISRRSTGSAPCRSDRAALPRRLLLDARRVLRRRGVLRGVRVPHHLAAPRGARANGSVSFGAVLAAARPAAAAGALRRAGRRRRLGRVRGIGRAAVATAARHPVVDLLRRQLGPDPRRRAVLRR